MDSNTIKLKKLVERTRQLDSHIENQDFLIQRNPEQIDESSRKLVTKAARVSGDVAKNKAHYLLAGQGFDADKLARNLNSINLKTTFDSVEPISETDIDAYLRHEHELLLLTAIEESKKETIGKLEEAFTQTMEYEWEQAKQELLDHQLHAAKFSSGAPKKDVPLQAPLSSPLALPSSIRSGLSSQMKAYASVIQNLNAYNKKKRPFAILSAMKHVADNVAPQRDYRKNEIVDCWDILVNELGEHNGTPSGEFQGTGLRKNEYESFAPAKFVMGAKQFLEQQYYSVMTAEVKKKPLVAKVGAVPSGLKTVEAFLNIKFSQGQWPEGSEVVDGYPIWAQMYYCIRCGDLNSAFALAEKKSSYIGPSFLSYLKYYTQILSPENRESWGNIKAIWDTIRQEYKVLVSKGRVDVYKLAVYNVIGLCDPKKLQPIVFATTQDFMWLKLNHILIHYFLSNGDPQLEPLQDLQRSLVQYGPNHFNKDGRNPLLYFQVLLLSLQFEEAILYLGTIQQYQVEAVHFAISLYHYGFLHARIGSGASSLDMVGILRHYVSAFSPSDCVDAFYYYLLLDDPTQRRSCVQELLLETREFNTLIPLLIENEMGDLVSSAAKELQDQGKFVDAIDLYHRAQEFSQVIDIIVTQLSRVIVPHRTAERNRVIELAREISVKYGNDPSIKIDDDQWKTFQHTLLLVKFFDHYTQQQFNEALRIIESMDIIPLDANSIEQKVGEFNGLHNCIKNNIGDIFLAAMDTYTKLYSNLKLSGSQVMGLRDGGREKKMQEYRSKARALVMFAGMIKYRLPSSVTTKLIRMEVFMN